MAIAAALSLLVLLAAGPAGAADEVQLPAKVYERLSQFEANAIDRADKAFGKKKKYKEAFQEYHAFILQFRNSKAIPYALLRKGRCLQLAGKRNSAIPVYQDVIDYFPKALLFSGAAKFYQGQCHWDNQDREKAYKVWAEMAEDEAWSKHYLAAGAINKLADNLVKLDRASQAVRYYMQVAKDFRSLNWDQADYAVDKTVYHFIRRNPDVKKLAEFYTDMRTFNRRARRVRGKALDDRDFWNLVRHRVKRFDHFDDDKDQLRTNYYNYWAKAMIGRFPGWDDYQLDIADFRFHADGDRAKWIAALDRQFAAHQKTGDVRRIIRWIKLLRHHKAKVKEYYAKLDPKTMSYGELFSLMRVLYDDAREPEMARNVFEYIKLTQIKDEQRSDLVNYFSRKEGEDALVQQICATFADPAVGKYHLLNYYSSKDDLEHGLPLAEELTTDPRFAAEAQWIKATLYHGDEQYDKAIAAYQGCNDPKGAHLWGIVSCHREMKRWKSALGQLSEIENFFKDQSSRAAFAMADVHREAKDRTREIAALRRVLRDYPKSREASKAHQRLEKMDVERIGHAVREAED